jgi:EpsI family protein
MARSTIVLACLLMVFGAVAAYAMTPRLRVADTREHNLEQMIPRSFAGWHEGEASLPVLPDPSASRLTDKIYNTLLARSYRNSAGETVMLVIAYGGDQSDALQLHRPEVCYAANGYQVSGLRYERREVAGRNIALARLDTEDHDAQEVVSYWMRVGERQVTTTMDRQWVKLVSGLGGVIPDGVLVRVSTRTLVADPAHEHAIHDRFIADLLSALDDKAQALLIGRGAPGDGRGQGG